MRKLIIGVLLSSFIFLTGCGTIFYPERRGNATHLDVGVTILDGIGLIFFIIPGVIAYAVDFSTGCIYLSGKGRNSRISLAYLDYSQPIQPQIDKIISNYYDVYDMGLP